MWLLLAALVSVSEPEMCRAHTLQDASVAVTCPAQTPPHLEGLPFADIPKSSYKTLDRTQRHKWRLVNGALVVDPTVPDVPPSKEHRRTAVCGNILRSPTVDPLLKDLCATF